ncbi:TIGR02680 family protein [Virgibacillus sp. NKC19-16]|uniref:TIGR02680 family protein n=1 Tax=Virgibacillus salidurans TaxID=2831673 RepID=UPI001F4412E5|nr:TIGR02680 family protein [Virgibacillus sp. NKC19-16]UJL46721.1 TIGR02680 family protein [Virgibacillus sp. NKC19-16]
MSETVDKWQMHRAKLFSFWYYPDQEFYFTDGCAVLRGHNGSGKSVTTQSLITVLLDGDVRSHKLDPFGGRERNITDTVLGEEGLLGINERIGYILLEFKKENSQTYKTIGMGIEARRGKAQNKVWYFIVDGKRFGNGEGFLKLYKEEIIEGSLKKLPLNENQLRNLIETENRCGRIFTDRKDYADKVNKHLFGFDTLENFMGLIDLLIQIRSPKLSDKNRPEGVAEVINDSLPQLTEGELRPLTDSIESIDRIEKDLQDTRKDLKSMEKLNDVFVKYNQIALVEKATEYRKAEKSLNKLKTEISQREKEVKKQNERLEEIESSRTKLSNQLEVKREELNSLGVKDIEEIEGRKQEAERDFNVLSQTLQSLNEKLDNTVKRKQEAQKKKEAMEADLYTFEKEFKGFIQELDSITEEMDFSKHHQYMTHLVANQNEPAYSFLAWKEEVKKYGQFLTTIKSDLEKYEKLRDQLGRIDNDLGDIQMKIDASQTVISDCKDKIDEEIINVVEAVQQWADNTTSLKVDQETKDSLIEAVEDVFDQLSKEAYLNPLEMLYQQRKEENQSRKVSISHQISLLETEKANIESEITEWENKEEIEPTFVEKKRKAWKALTEAGIDYVPFYEAFEFDEAINPHEALNYQHALMESGILQAVIVKPEDVDKAKQYTTVLEYGDRQKSNLATVLKSSHGSHLEKVLTSISVEEKNGTYILASGAFKSGLVKGKASQQEDALFIGKAAREMYRQEKVRSLKEARDLTDEQIAEQQSRLTQTKEAQANMEAEYESFPSLANLSELYTKINTEQQTITQIYEPSRKKLSDEYSDIDEESKKLLVQIKAKLDFTELDLTIEAFETELRNQQDYMQCLQDMETSFTKKMNAKASFADYSDRCTEYETQVDENRSDVLDNESKQDKAKERISTYENRLREMGSEDIRNRITELTQEINTSIPEQLNEIVTEHANVVRDIETGEQFITEKKENEVPFKTVVHEAWEKEFQAHYKLGYLVGENDASDYLEIAEEIEKQYGSMIDKKREEIEKVKNRLTNTFNTQNIELFHYELEMQTAKSDYLPSFDTDDDSKNATLNLMSDQLSRIIVTMNVDGERVPPTYAVKHLTERIERLDRDINEKDRDLYERILVNTLGDTIRRKITYVQRWEKEMNKFMEHENLIKFRLSWKPKKKENEEQLDTLKLVEALKRDSQWIDVDEISSHFRSKIKIARRRHESQTHKEYNLKEIMREELDYRKWFEFEIYFTKKNDKEKKLTRNTYGELSGGQRVLAMITPVLAALYAKYSEASETCPRIFTLDEAFSRVDDDNINIMFEYIRKLNFNYILNSQSLWGCYASVPSLNIYELSRPENRPHVLIDSYYWNGKKKVRTEQLESGEERLVTS